MRPCRPIRTQTGAHRIHANVVGFFREAFPRAQPVFEKIRLPRETPGFRGETFPRTHRGAQTGSRRKGGQQVQVIGHDDDQMQMPAPDAVVADSGVDDLSGTIQQNTSSTFTRTDG